MKTLILAEHNGKELSPAVQQAVTAAQFWQAPIDLLVAGGNDAILQTAASIQGVTRVIHANAAHLAHPLAEDIANLVVSLAEDYQVILASHSSYSRNVLPRVSALLDVAMISNALTIQADNTYTRSCYAGNVHYVVQSIDKTQVLTIHGSNFAAASLGANTEIINIDAPAAFTKTRWVSETHNLSHRPALSSAKIVISGGRSLGSAEKFEEVLSPLAAKLGAALGATRAAVDAGYAPNDIQVGQTGVVVAPELYFAIGVSGAVQHTYGMKDSKIIVAINQDPDAPIFQVADYGLVADLFDVVPKLTEEVNSRN
ncbi:FAD-binding protein [Methylotenera versatilis]|uniref:FAD-binding protein n=1 Tax=Methylotenera versatilis TaxID=1055487 RepID=UPI000648C55E|nr:FAD-binding protein [Methylotenera versatilis]